MEQSEKPTEEFRKFPLFVILACGLIIFFIGVFLLISQKEAFGISQPNKFGNGGGKQQSISGFDAIFFGLMICIFPVYQLLKKRKL